jgi:hypothetical protein
MRQRAPLLLTGMSKRMCSDFDNGVEVMASCVTVVVIRCVE